MEESSKTNEHSPGWRSPPKIMRDFLDRWPRFVALATCQLWFMVLIFVSFIMGGIISKIEGPVEITANDAFMRRTFMIKNLPINETISKLIALPGACIMHFEANRLREEQEPQPNNSIGDGLLSWNNTDSVILSENNTTGSNIDQIIADLRTGDTFLMDTNATWEQYFDFANLTFEDSRNYSLNNVSDTIESTAYYEYLSGNATTNFSLGERILDYAQACGEIAQELIYSIIEFSNELYRLDRGSDDPTFNWIRCWDPSRHGVRVFRLATEEQRNASLISSQVLYFNEQWNANRQELFERFVAEDGCDIMPDEDNRLGTSGAKDMCYWEATKKSVLSATGAAGCVPNISSAAWFWFTVMTTVGYGNSPPSTFSSRLLVFCFGWVMIIAFGGILVKVGYVFTALLNDLTSRTNLKLLKNSKYSAPFWALASCLYIVIVAGCVRRFWNAHVPEEVFSRGDSLWFSYITLLTVGLGDFFLQPQGLFVADVIGWTFLLLYGFGVFASFLDRFSNLLGSLLPERNEPLEYHLARTELFCGTGINTPYSKSMEVLKELVAESCIDEDENIAVKRPLEVKYRSSFRGRDSDARTPDGSTIHMHRIGILTEKKRLLMKLLLANQLELDDRIDSCKAENGRLTNELQLICSEEGGNNSLVGSILSSRFDNIQSLPMPTIESLKLEEDMLNSILLRTQELRQQLDNSNLRDDELGHQIDLSTTSTT